MAVISGFLKGIPGVSHAYEAIETVATRVDGTLRMIPVVKTIYNPASDLVKRTATLLDGELNFDIVRTGPKQLESVGQLLPGDILLKQGDVVVGADSVSVGIQAGQMMFNSSGHKYVGAGLLTHAAVYVGEDDVVESVGGGVARNSLKYDYNRHYTWYVIRCNNDHVKAHVAQIAIAASQANPKIEYAAFGAAKAGLLGDIAVSELSGNDPTARDRARIKNGQKTAMYCSEFVMYCYNCACDELKISRFSYKAQDAISPEELYVMMRDNANFEYIGELHAHKR